MNRILFLFCRNSSIGICPYDHRIHKSSDHRYCWTRPAYAEPLTSIFKIAFRNIKRSPGPKTIHVSCRRYWLFYLPHLDPVHPCRISGDSFRLSLQRPLALDGDPDLCCRPPLTFGQVASSISCCTNCLLALFLVPTTNSKSKIVII